MRPLVVVPSGKASNGPARSADAKRSNTRLVCEVNVEEEGEEAGQAEREAG